MSGRGSERSSQTLRNERKELGAKERQTAVGCLPPLHPQRRSKAADPEGKRSPSCSSGTEQLAEGGGEGRSQPSGGFETWQQIL